MFIHFVYTSSSTTAFFVRGKGVFTLGFEPKGVFTLGFLNWAFLPSVFQMTRIFTLTLLCASNGVKMDDFTHSFLPLFFSYIGVFTPVFYQIFNMFCTVFKLILAAFQLIIHTIKIQYHTTK
jgi:hypothetical protein